MSRNVKQTIPKTKIRKEVKMDKWIPVIAILVVKIIETIFEDKKK